MSARGEGVRCKSFAGKAGGSEHFICVQGRAGLGVDQQTRLIEARYAEACQALSLKPETAIFRRIFVSDVLNQFPLVNDSGLVRQSADNPVAVSIVQQPPLPGAKIALLAYHVEADAPIAKHRLAPKHVLVKKNGLSHLWSTRLCAGADQSEGSALTQTRGVFGELIDALASQGGSLREHCVRTWLFLKDVDVFYDGMVEGRRELFARHGLSRDTHFIASTGIEGACAHRHDLVAMDAYSILGLAPTQISYLNDFDRLCPTANYGVTFERATRIAYADRAHNFISGTASIDHAGRVVHPGDVLGQLERALGNVDSLLDAGEAGLSDMMYVIVYLRDPTDFARVDAYLAENLPGIPFLIVQAAVCRPEWLVEIEGVAVTANEAPELPDF